MYPYPFNLGKERERKNASNLKDSYKTSWKNWLCVIVYKVQGNTVWFICKYTLYVLLTNWVHKLNGVFAVFMCHGAIKHLVIAVV